MGPEVIQALLRIRKRLRMLNSPDVEVEDAVAARTVRQQYVQELRAVHGRLPAPLRRKSWILSIEHGTPW